MPNPNEHTGLVIHLTQEHVRKFGGDFEELLGVAWLAMHRASETFRADLGYRFSTLASKSIRMTLYEATMADKGMKRTSSGWKRGVAGFSEMGDRGYMGDVEAKPERMTPRDGFLLEAAALAAGDVFGGREVCGLLAKGMSQAQIARVMGVSRQRVNQIVLEVRRAAKARIEKEVAP